MPQPSSSSPHGRPLQRMSIQLSSPITLMGGYGRISNSGAKAQRHQAATLIQRAWRAHAARQTAKCERKRRQLATEFVDLEKTYASNLAYMRINYEEPLREKVRVLVAYTCAFTARRRMMGILTHAARFARALKGAESVRMLVT